MDLDRFRRTLDRFGSAFSAWPLADARAARRLMSLSARARGTHALARRIEAGIGFSRPAVRRNQARAVVARAVVEIARREMRPSAGRALRIALMDPWTRTAFVLSLTAIGFAIGMATGSPDLTRARDSNDGPFVTAIPDDVSF